MKSPACGKLILFALPCLLVAACGHDDDDDDGFTISTIGASLKGLKLNTLDTAIKAADLDDDLSDTASTFTLFAPTDDAFDLLPPGTLDDLLLPASQPALIDTLLFHTLGSEVDAATALGLSSATSLNGDELVLDVVGGDLFINDARVMEADIFADNGVIHKIDRVLLPPQDIAATLTDRGFSTLVTAAVAADLDDDLAAPGDLTILAPTDAAFDALPAGTLAFLLDPANQAELIALLNYHLIAGSVTASAAVGVETATTLAGTSTLFSEDDDGPLVNGVRISAFNIPCTNGVIHVIDAVLTEPSDVPTTATDLGFSTLVTALVAAELDDDLAGAGPFTVFAPTNDAFDALPAGALTFLLDPVNQADLIDVLTYHVVVDELTANEVLAAATLPTLQGSDLTVTASPPMVDGANIITTNVLASNGIIHAIDGVLLPPGFSFPTSQPSASDNPPFGELDPSTLPAPADLVGLMVDNSAAALPAWSAGDTALVAGWDRFDGATAGPRAADAAGSGDASLVLEAGTFGVNADGDLAFPASPNLRVDANINSIPYEVVLQVRGAGSDELAATLRLAAPGGVVELAPTSSLELTSGETLYVWQPDTAGLPAHELDVVLSGEGSGAVVEALRFLALR